jgi:hypothetical protein
LKIENGKWKMENGRRKMGELKMEEGRWNGGGANPVNLVLRSIGQ